MAYPEKIKQRAIELYQDCSAAKALKALEKEFPDEDLPNERSVRRWRRRRNEKLLEEHFQQMKGIAKPLLTGLEEVTENPIRGSLFDILKYTIMHEGSGRGVTLEQLRFKVQMNLEATDERYSNSDRKSFISHISTETPEIKTQGLPVFALEKPYEFIQALKTLVQGNKLKGTCPVCKDWQ